MNRKKRTSSVKGRDYLKAHDQLKALATPRQHRRRKKRPHDVLSKVVAREVDDGSAMNGRVQGEPAKHGQDKVVRRFWDGREQGVSPKKEITKNKK